ncbi:ribonuclease E inhibitor RraB [Sulfurovum mangrovi]|uniref:ribonuclease E inhibitor RraB n=1 Tax=Sulfurovum mangrovi TaxID=2893889 RepID=UPI001E38F350|nr:ribonuclease E inhibitor RraB [Sulfurovum mangrovi]UFH60781.1 ribonuclease E inhibitor RraB [Sulfurovum mangrovi]
MHLARAIEHKLFFSNGDEKQDELISRLEAQGFKVQPEIESEEGIKGLKFYRIDKPFYHDIDELTLYLIDLLEEHGASYDGWETSVVKS